MLVRRPKTRVKDKVQKQMALSLAEGLKLAEAAAAEELAVIVMGLDTSARIGDAFGMEASRVELKKGKITFRVEKSDFGHTVACFLRPRREGPGKCTWIIRMKRIHIKPCRCRIYEEMQTW